MEWHRVDIRTCPDAARHAARLLERSSCVSAKACKAVGSHYDGSGHFSQTLIEAWNGTRWTIASSPSVPYNANGLENVSCTNLTSCKAVGSYSTASGTAIPQTLLLAN